MRIRVVCVRQYGAEEEAWALELDRLDLKAFHYTLACFESFPKLLGLLPQFSHL